ncbi:MAG TPA: carboxypeptidase regulatory-like domain-containing protein [Longimicrobiales bacterium]
MHTTTRLRLLVGLTCALTACGGGGTDPYNPDPGPPTVVAKGSIHGIVQDEAAAPIADAQVQITASGGATRTTASAADGSYTFNDVPVGVWQMSVTAPTGFQAGSVPAVTVASGQQTSVGAIVLTRTAAPPPPLTAAVGINSSSFQPADVTIRQGGSVSWTNYDAVSHTATAAGFDTGVLAKDQTSTKVFNSAGTFDYACTIHPGMQGRVIVQ